MNGRVYLVGGGPGAIDLYTVKALECIKSADCIIYDRLIDPAILNYCKETCEKIYVGKASNNHTLAQDNINLLLIEKARQYAQVVAMSMFLVVVAKRPWLYSKQELTLKLFRV